MLKCVLVTFRLVCLFVSTTCSVVAPASSPSVEEVARQPKSSTLQGKRLLEPRSLLIRLMTEGRGQAGSAKMSKKAERDSKFKPKNKNKPNKINN